MVLVNLHVFAQTTTISPNVNGTSTARPGECTEEGTFPGLTPGEFYMCRYDNSRNKFIKYSGQCKAEYVKTMFDPKEKKCVPKTGEKSRLMKLDG